MNLAYIDTPKNVPKILNAWCMYDWANSVYALVITTAIFPIYYFKVTPESINLFTSLNIPNDSLKAFTIAASFFLIILIGPVLGGLADAFKLKKILLMLSCYVGGLSCIGMFWFESNTIFLGLFCFLLGTFCFGLSEGFYNAYLPEIATPDRFERLSAKGYSLGYLGSTLLLVMILLGIEHAYTLGLDASTATRTAFILTGVWWIGFGSYVFMNLPRGKSVRLLVLGSTGVMVSGFKQLWFTFQEILMYRQTWQFLLTYFVYSVGLQTVMYVAVDFGSKELKLEDGNLILSLLIIQLIAIPGAFFFAYLSDKISNIFSLKIMILVWICICIYAYFTYSAIEFYILGGLVGIVMGGIQSVSRATYTAFLPEMHRSNVAFFSIYSATDKLAVMTGTLLFGLLNMMTGSMRVSILCILAYFVAGGLLLLFFSWEKKERISTFHFDSK